MLNEKDDDVEASHEAGDMQRSKSGFGCGLDQRSVLDEQFDDLDAVLLAGDVQRRESVEGARVDLRLPVQQNFGDAVMSAMRSHVQGG